MFVVTVNFRIYSDQIEAFLPLMLEQARNSLSREAGCQVFDVCQDPDDKEEVFLYEVYDDRQAFDLHLNSDHYKRFDDAVADLVAAKEVRLFSGIFATRQ